jgi:hypothetical protein
VTPELMVYGYPGCLPIEWTKQLSDVKVKILANKFNNTPKYNNTSFPINNVFLFL